MAEKKYCLSEESFSLTHEESPVNSIGFASWFKRDSSHLYRQSATKTQEQIETHPVSFAATPLLEGNTDRMTDNNPEVIFG